ncbi:hypothetical protein MMC29_002184, partial [Sticta canariensis]|nr:hypothetical protein [Sticta canariensis]
MSKRLAKNDYTVGWVCALQHETAAAKGMLDEIHEDLQEQDTSDHNSYVLGQIGHHDIVIACLPAGVIGNTPAATVAKDMLRTFPSIRFGLLVGIAGAAPSSTHDIRLGDVVVSKPHGVTGGVIQYDRGHVNAKGKFQRTGSLNSPPMILLTALSRLRMEHELSDSAIPLFLSRMYERYPKTRKEYAFQGKSDDQLYQPTYEHPETNKTCAKCDPKLQVQREPREGTDPQIYYGNIASSNEVMKCGVKRDQLREELDILCFEMEAAGLMPDFPCLVIRGICDYSDSHKNDKWQKYAAATAAGFAKELLGVISADRVRQEKKIVQVSDSILQEITTSIDVQVRQHAARQERRYENDRHRVCHQAFKTSFYEQFKNNNPRRAPRTCRWVLENEMFSRWWQIQKDGLLWISADPGCGKSVLARSLIDNELRSTSTHTICYFFFKDNEEQNSLATALCALLHQLFNAQPQLIRYAMASWDKNAQKLQTEVYELWEIFLTAVTSENANCVTVVMDALDECREKDRQTLIELLYQFYVKSLRPVAKSSCLKVLATSRPYNEIENDFQRTRPLMIRLRGELENDAIHEEINLVILERIATLAERNKLSPNTTEELKQKLLGMKHRTYLWLYLAIDDIETTIRKSFQPDLESIESLLLPESVYDAYEKILTRVPKNDKNRVVHILHIIIGARRPLTTSEMAMALDILRGSQSFAKFKDTEGRVKDLICDVCGLFVFINHSKIYLIHQTAKEFLVQSGLNEVTDLWRHSLNPSESETIMARICVEYLSLSELNDFAQAEISKATYPRIRHYSKYLEMGKYHEITVLLLYSSENWAAHFRNASFEPKDVVVSKARELSRVE